MSRANNKLANTFLKLMKVRNEYGIILLKKVDSKLANIQHRKKNCYRNSPHGHARMS